MKLAILVVYLFDAKTAPLLKLHINYIRKFTDVPYTIYGSISRLKPKMRKKLSDYAEVKQCNIPATALRGGDEHAYYLEHLAEIAIQEGATHLVTLHLDSFPVCEGWAQKLQSLTDQTGSCVALDLCYTACLFFTKEFYLRCKPKFSGALEPAAYHVFIKDYQLINHSGAPYLYRSYTHQLLWHILKKTTGPSEATFGDIYGGLIFHLRAAIRLSPKFQVTSRALLETAPLAESKARKWVIDRIRAWRKYLYTKRLWNQLCEKLPSHLIGFVEKWMILQPRLLELLEMKISIRTAQTQLLQDPDSYLSSLQSRTPISEEAIQRFPE